MYRMICILGRRVWQSMRINYPQGVYDIISSLVDATDTHRKGINMGTATTVGTEVIFNRTLGIIGSGEFDLLSLFFNRLAPIPT